jgi:adenine-specific DNA methylase
MLGLLVVISANYMSYRKKLIEVSMPLEAINQESAREKSIRHGHPSTLHLWWARRPLAACRAVLFASLVDDPSAHPDKFPTEEEQQAERQRLHDLIGKIETVGNKQVVRGLVSWDDIKTDETGTSPIIEAAQKEIARCLAWENKHEPPTEPEAVRKYLQEYAPPVYDPFCGGGSIPLEAQRLGIEAHGSDLNPVAVLITKALIEIPPKFKDKPPVNPEARKTKDINQWKGAQGLAEDVRYYGKWMRDEAQKRIGHLYPQVELPKEHGGGEATVIAWLWARTVKCPNPACGCQMPLVRSFELSKKKGKEAWVEPIVDSSQSPPVIKFEVKTGKGKPIEGTTSRKGAVCLACATPTNLDYIRSEGKAGRINAQLMAIVAEGNKRRIYLSPDEKHEKIAASAQPEWKSEAMLPNNTRDIRPQIYGLPTYGDLFTSRQLVALNTLCNLIKEVRERIRQDAIVQKITDDNSSTASTGWETMLEGLIQAGFSITGTLPLRTELSNRMVGNGANVLASSIALVCRPRLDDAPSATRRQFLKQLQTEFPTDLKNLQQGNIAPVDLAQASIGLGMSVFSRYSKVLEADGNPMRVRTALQIINSYIDEFLNEQEGEFDPDTRWALTWFEQYQFEAGQYGDAETLSKAKNTSIKGLEEAGILLAKNGKVRLLKREELPKTWNPAKDDRTPDWEATQHLIQTLDKQGETGAAILLAQLGDKGEVCRDLAYRLYVICDRQGWTQQAISYNSLVTSWSEISRLAAMEQQSEKMVQGKLAVY